MTLTCPEEVTAHWSLVTKQLRKCSHCSPLCTTPPVPGKMWQDKGSSKSGKGAEGKGSTQKSTVRIAVISIWADAFKTRVESIPVTIVWICLNINSTMDPVWSSSGPRTENAQKTPWDFPRGSRCHDALLETSPRGRFRIGAATDSGCRWSVGRGQHPVIP